jgi:hypothetical protein
MKKKKAGGSGSDEGGRSVSSSSTSKYGTGMTLDSVRSLKKDEYEPELGDMILFMTGDDERLR